MTLRTRRIGLSEIAQGFDRSNDRALSQPFIRRPIPHNELFPDEPHEHGQFGFDEADGETVLPEPCWDQQPNAEKLEIRRPERQWGDREVIEVGRAQTMASSQLLDMRLQLPAVCTLVLSAVDLTGFLAATNPLLFVTWTVDWGVGRATQSKNYVQVVEPLSGITDTDLIISRPVHALRVQATVTDGIADSHKYFVQLVAQVAPNTTSWDLVHE